MKKSDYIIILLLMLSCGAGYLYLLFPGGVEIFPFIYSDKNIYYHWYIWLLTTNIRICILSAIILIVGIKKIHWITKDVVIISLIIVIFELLWFILYYNNPFHISEAIIKGVIATFVYLSIKSIQWHARTNNSIFSRRDIRRID